MTITTSTLVADIATANPGTIKVFQRHRIDFCCGGRIPLGDVCEAHQIAAPVLIGELEEVLNLKETDVDWTTASLASLVSHIQARFHRPLEEEVELDPGVAAHAGARRAAGEIVLHERTDDLLPELLVQAQGVVRDARLLRHPLRVSEIERAAATAVGLDPGLVPEQHGEAHHRDAALRQQPGGHRGVQASAHGHSDHAETPAGATRRSSATSRARASRKPSISSLRFVMPKLIRSEDRASSRERPMARSVLLGSTVPEEQADPVETA